jgi:hypothetical protein
MRRSVRVLVASTLIAALTLSLDSQAQDKKPAPVPGTPAAPATPATPVAAPTQQQDRIDIGNALDSWYRIYQKDMVVGFSHEILTRARPGNPYRYSYNADSEMELMAPDPKDPKKEIAHVESVHVDSTQLDDTYAPLSMERKDNRDGAEVTSKVVGDDSGKRIEVVVGSDRKTYPVSTEEELHYSRFLMFISLRQNGKLSKPGTQRALLLEPRADDQSPISEVQLEVHEVVKKEYLGKKDVSVTRVTYLKPPPSPTRDGELLEAFIDKFGRVVEETTRGGVRRVLVKDESEALGQNERVRQGGRRDPFRKDLAMYVDPNAPKTGVDQKGPPVDPSNIVEVLKKIESLIEELKKAKEEKREDEGNKIYTSLIEIFSLMRQNKDGAKPIQPVEQARLKALQDMTEEIWGGLDRLMRTLRTTYVAVTEAFNRDDCDAMAKGIEDLKKAVQTKKELEDTPQLSQVLKWIGELEPLVNKCRTRIELGRKKIVLTGTLLHEDVQMLPVEAAVMAFGVQIGGLQDVRFTKLNRIAVINEKMYRIGDVVEGEGVRVEKIWAFGVQVSLREEVRDVGIRQK